MIVIDDFHPDFPRLLKWIEGVEFGPYTLEGKDYTGVGQVTLPVKALIEDHVGPIKIKANHLRLGRKDTPLTHNIHTDRYGTSLGFVWCLSAPDCESGTAFWKHNETGLERLPVDAPKDLWELFDEAIQDESQWSMTEMVGSRENRAVIFETDRFHSRWPRVLPVEAQDKPRIVCTVFFDRL